MSATEEYATYVWTDPGQFGAWLTSEERYALLDIFCFYPRDDADWTRLTNNDPRVPVYLTGGTKARFVEIATTTPPGSDPHPIPQGMGFSGHKNLNFNRVYSENNQKGILQ